MKDQAVGVDERERIRVIHNSKVERAEEALIQVGITWVLNDTRKPVTIVF